MRNILAAFKVIAFPLWTLMIYLFYAFILIFIKISGRHYEPWRNRCMGIWGRVTAALFSIKIETEGTPPEPPFFIVSNHLSYIDVAVYAAVLKTTFVSKIEVKHWPVVGFMAKTLGIIFIDRRKRSDVHRVNEEISSQVNEHQGVILFPEGTTSPGFEIMRFRPALLQHAAEEEIEVSYSALRYQTTEKDVSAHLSVCWWGNKPMLKHLFNMGKNRSVQAKIRFGQDRVKDSDRKNLAEKLQKKVEEVFIPVIDEPEEDFEPLQF